MFTKNISWDVVADQSYSYGKVHRLKSPGKCVIAPPESLKKIMKYESCMYIQYTSISWLLYIQYSQLVVSYIVVSYIKVVYKAQLVKQTPYCNLYQATQHCNNFLKVAARSWQLRWHCTKITMATTTWRIIPFQSVGFKEAIDKKHWFKNVIIRYCYPPGN